ncbi:MAG: hypothetical protein CL883_05570 [Dehalococcoidia bacterium]|nr:hypothetical protein [Dehalococcoidia bacterium]|tara:strand:- start:409 stop:630 length:222 start_codon:yes stop_codon:yes gene_type:complete
MFFAYYFAIGFSVAVLLSLWVIWQESKEEKPQKFLAKDFFIFFACWPFALTLWIAGRIYRGVDKVLKDLQDYD